ncbi:MAG: lamin tail domain-containing protein [Myxococcales bacterium]|nr:lamin tail domain-containing protein [Myxococcales bacterium]
MSGLLLLLACSQPFVVEDTGDSSRDSAADSAGPEDTGDVEPLSVCINEFMPHNAASAYDGLGLASDWIELHNPGEVDLDLTGWTLTDDVGETDKHLFDGLGLGAGGYLLLWASGDEAAGPDHVGFSLAQEGGEVGLYDPDGQGAVVQYGTVETDFAVARLTDCCSGAGCLDFTFRGTPGYSNEPIVYETVPMIAPGSIWRYWTGAAVDNSWSLPAYYDDAWLSGTAPLGYGDAQATMIEYGGDPANKWITSWFRLAFDVTGVDQLETMTIDLMRDDGALVYVNGTEVLRSNMPEGEVVATTLASAVTASETGFYTFSLDPGPLFEGTNVVAVELHQASVTTTDAAFDLALSGDRRVQ